MRRKMFTPHKTFLKRLLTSVLLLTALLPAAPAGAQQRKVDKNDIERGRKMLKIAKKLIEGNYYDPKFHGVDMEARFREADEMLKRAESHGQISGIIAHTLLYFDDSHTYFLPPDKAPFVEYGWRMEMIGDTCYVTAVKPGSDAERQGLKAGDIMHSVDGMRPTRRDLWKIYYLHNVLRPVMRVHLVVQGPEQAPRELDVRSELLQFDLYKGTFRRLNIGDSDEEEESKEDKKKKDKEAEERAKKEAELKDYRELGDDLFVWKFESFQVWSTDRIDDVVKKARRHKGLILDLRDNGGGYETIMLRLIGYFTDRDIEVGHIVRRKERRALVAKTQGDRVYTGKLVVLINSNSGSAAEVFARAVQLMKRGTVLGDRSAGAVMRGRLYWERAGIEVYGSDAIRFGVNVTDADLVMTDGKSLERTGVTPDELVLPTATDLASRRDPVLTRAASLLGVQLDPSKAAALFPVSWK